MGGSEIQRYETVAGRVVYCVPVQAFDEIEAENNPTFLFRRE